MPKILYNAILFPIEYEGILLVQVSPQCLESSNLSS
jgi:hypothetical protein